MGFSAKFWLALKSEYQSKLIKMDLRAMLFFEQILISTESTALGGACVIKQYGKSRVML